MKHKQRRNSLMDDTKDTVKLGIGSMAGMGAIGAMTKIPGMPNTPIPGIVGSGLAIANIGQLGKTGMNMAHRMGNQTRQRKKK